MKAIRMIVVIALSVSMVFTMMPMGTLQAMAIDEPQQAAGEQSEDELTEPQAGSEDSQKQDEETSDEPQSVDATDQNGAGAEEAAGGSDADVTDSESEYQDISVTLKDKAEGEKLPADKEHGVTVSAANPNEEGDAVVRLYFWNYDKDFFDKDKKDEVKEICDNVTIKDLKDDDTITLDNETKDADKVKAELVTEKAAPDTDVKVRYLEFTIPSDTKYKFNLPLVLEEDVIKNLSEEAESLHVIIEPTVEGQDEDSNALGEAIDVEWKPELSEKDEAKADKAEDGSTADYVNKNGVEGADVSGKAAGSKDKAEEALAELTELTENKAEKVAKTLFAAKGGEGEGDPEADGDDEDQPRPTNASGDGSNIDVMTARWITVDTVDNDNEDLLYVRPDQNSRSERVRLQINYALSGEHRYDPGDIVITVPANMFKDRSGKNTGSIIVPYPEDPSRKSDFNWKQVGDNIVITNTKSMSAATKGFIQLEFDGLDPTKLVDMAVSEEFVATIDVTTHKGNILSLSTQPLTAQFDTQAELTRTNKRPNGVTRIKAAQLPANQRIEGVDEYIKADWYVWCSTNANTYYTIDQIDLIPQASVVEIRKIVADDFENFNEKKHIKESDASGYETRTVVSNSYSDFDPDQHIRLSDATGCAAGDSVAIIKTEADAEGFVLGGNPPSSSLEKDNVYTGSKDGNGSYYYFSTVYPANQFETDVNYTFHNTIKYTVTEVDPEVAENTNPNVNNGDPDPQKVTTGTASAQTVWSYSDPKWINPGGHYMVGKNGNDDTPNGNKTHKSTYTYNDLHLNGDGYYGIYPSAINRLQDEYRDKGENGSVRLSYTINTRGYTLPWMYDGGLAEFREGVQAARIIGNYNRPVTMTTTDTGVSIGRNGEKLQVFDDYTFAEVEFPNEPYVFKGKPQNINADGSWTALTAGDGTFLYTRDTDKANWPDIKLQIRRDGQWEDFATVSWKSGQRVIVLESGPVLTDTGVVSVPEDTETFRTIVTTQNTVGGEGATEALQAAIEYDIRPVINLKSTKKLVDSFDALFEQTNLPSLAIYNSTNMLVERADVSVNNSDREIVSIDREGYDSIRGYTTDTAVYPYKESTQYLREVDYENRNIVIHYKARIEERSVINEKKTWQEAVDEGRLVSEREGIWRDLLPKGVTPDISTIRLRDKDSLLDVQTIEDYKESGRTMLVVKVKLVPVPESYRSGDMTYYEDVPTISFDANYDFESWKDYGSNIHNVISFESGNDFIGTIPGYTGEPDDPSKNNNVSTKNAFRDNEKELMTDLNEDGNDPENKPTFVYAGATTNIDILAAARTSLYKDVQVNNDGIWNEGTYYGNTTEATEGGNKRTVYEGGQYSYRLRVMSDPATISTGMVIYDVLEDFHAKGEDNDSIDKDAVEAEALWKGTLRGVDTSQLVEMGCAPVVYYSTKVRNYKDSNDPTYDGDTHYDPDYALTQGYTDDPVAKNIDIDNKAGLDDPIWIKASDYNGSMSDVTAVAIDCRYANDNAKPKNVNVVTTSDGRTIRYFRLQPMESAVILVKMHAPSGQTARDLISQTGTWGDSAMAYNNAYLHAASFDDDGSPTQNYDETKRDFIRKDYTKVGLKEYSLTATKQWADDSDRDGRRPATVTFRLYANDEPTDETRTLNVEEGENEVTFNNIPYTDDNGEKIHYVIKEEAIEGYTDSYKLDDTTFHFTNTHEPERTSVSGEKTWEGDTENDRPASINVQLYANGKLYKTQTVKPAPDGTWSYSFTNLYKYENKEEIKYTIEEVKTPNTGDKLDSYIPEVDGFDIVNTYHPFGDLNVSKKVINTTAVSENQKFKFTFNFTKTVKDEDGNDETVPVFDDFAYEILDAEGNAVTGDDGEPLTGTVTNNSELSIKGGQQIHVKEIPEGIDYKVTEEEVDGFRLTEMTGDSGSIVPNSTAEAKFTNTYRANGQVNLNAEKVLEGRHLTKYQFVFQLFEVGTGDDGEETIIEEKPSASNDAESETSTLDDGTVVSVAPVKFGVIRYTQEDHGKTFTYRVTETDRSKPGYTYSTEVYRVKVSVEDNGDGTLTVTPVYYDKDDNEIDKAVFNNEYHAVGSTELHAWKNLPGRDLTAGEFEFELLDEHGDPIMNSGKDADDDQGGQTDGDAGGDNTSDDPNADDTSGGDTEGTDDSTGTAVTATNKADGTVTFEPDKVEALNYTEKDVGKTYYYAVREKTGDDETVTYDDSVFGYAVTIKDNGDGTVYAEQKIMKPVFDPDDPSKIIDWTEDGAELPVFENELKDGGFSVAKYVVDSPNADPSQEFRFRIKLIGEKVTDELISNYTLSKAGEDPFADQDEESGNQDGEDNADADNTDNADADNVDAQNVNAQSTDVQNDGAKNINTENADTENADTEGDSSSGIRLRAAGDEGGTRAAGDIASGKCDALTDTSIWNFNTIINNAPAGTGRNYWTSVRNTVQQSGDKYSGVDWRITADGELIIGKEGETQYFYPWRARTYDTYPNTTQTYYQVPSAQQSGNERRCYSWHPYRDQIKSVRFEGTVIGQGDMNGLFRGCSNLVSADLNGFDTSDARGLGYMFYGCGKLTDLKNFEKLDTGRMIWINDLFVGCTALKEIDMSNFVTSTTYSMDRLFQNCSSVEYLDLSGFDMTSPTSNRVDLDNGAHAVSFVDSFIGCSSLNTVVLGPDFRFLTSNSSILPTPPDGQMWVRQEGDPGTRGSYTAQEVKNGVNNYGATWTGTWVWSGKTFYTVHFRADGAVGGTAPTRMLVGENQELPANTFQKYGYDFDHWLVTDANGNPIPGPQGQEQTYTDQQSIPANTYEMNDKVYLTAVFKEKDTSVEMQDGEFEIVLRDGEQANFNNIPAGTAYQIYEETPNGWVLVSQENASGMIQPLITSHASFKNRYEPGTTSIQLFGTKTLDNKAASANAYRFVLKENGEEIETVYTQDGGFIQFSPIVYEEAGRHTYTINEIDPNDESVDWDTHTETVTVNVEADDEGNLTATADYDDDRITFANKTRPGNLRLTKTAEGLTDANKEDFFTFRIRLNNANGMPLGANDKIYWYTQQNNAAQNASDDVPDFSDLQAKNNVLKTPLDAFGLDKEQHLSDITGNANVAVRAKAKAAASGKTDGSDDAADAKAQTQQSVKAPMLKAAGNRDAVAISDFSFTGSVQEYTVPVSGYYQIEAWGAQGGDSCLDGGTRNNESFPGTMDRVRPGYALGGCGGYTKGTIYLEEGTILYIYVGGRGGTGESGKISAGGWNGGGIGFVDHVIAGTQTPDASNGEIIAGTAETDGGGGGATDIRLTSGNWNDFASLKSRIMVAGGGGGASDTGHGGDAGGLNSTAGFGGAHTASDMDATIARQNSGNAFGVGQNGQLLENNYPSSGGGGGWYGGKHPNLRPNGTNYVWQNPGAGGSSFISGHSGCNAIAENSTANNIRHTGQPNYYDSEYVFTDTQMISGYNSMPKPTGETESNGHEGDGYARITPMSREITFNANGGTGEEVTREFSAGEMELPHAETLGMSKDNSIFAGWAKDANATTPDYEAGEDVVNKIGKTSKLYAVWIGENEYLLLLDANGGSVDNVGSKWIVADATAATALPDASYPTGGKTFIGWNTKKDGSGEMFVDTVNGEQLGAQPGDKITLYAQWEDGESLARYKVEHYRLNADGEGYSLYKAEYKLGERGAQVSPDEIDISGYAAKSHDSSYTIPETGTLVVKYYYDPCRFNVVYDGNGATSGQMNGTHEMLGGVQYQLWQNNYSKKGSIFVGWSTVENADPSTDEIYVDKAKVKNLTKSNGATVTLYAQWLSNEDSALEPTNGEIIVTCRAGESIVLPDLPAGTTYTIEEIDNPAGWSQSGEITGDGGTISANVTNDGAVTNVYHASGEAIIKAHKILEGAQIEEGQFEFELLDNDGEKICTASNGAIDTYEQIENENGNMEDNPYYQKSLVEFEPLEYTEEGTYHYTIREIPKDGDNSIAYDNKEVNVTVVVTDAGKGQLEAVVTYDSEDGLEPTFENTVKPAQLSISKIIECSIESLKNTEFTFTIELTSEDGEELTDSYQAVKGDTTINVKSGDKVTLKGGETITISGLPHGTTYSVTEEERSNWSLADSENTEGTLQAGESSDASFTNTYTPKVYAAEGSVQFTAKKVVEGGTILEDDNFSFELADESGEPIQVKGCDTDGNIEFDKITYTLDDLKYPDSVETAANDRFKAMQQAYDVAKKDYEDTHEGQKFKDFFEFVADEYGYSVNNYNDLLDLIIEEEQNNSTLENDFIYYVHEEKGEDPDTTYDSSRYYYKVHARDNGEGEIVTEVSLWKMGSQTVDDETGDVVSNDELLGEDEEITFVNKKTTEIMITKRWEDANNKDELRPETESFVKNNLHLMKNGTDEVTGVTPTIREDKENNKITILYEGLPAYDDEGNKIEYTVKEDGIEHYIAQDGKDEAADGETITNYHKPNPTDLKLTKKILDATSLTKDEVFEFHIEFIGEDGKPLEEQFTAHKEGSEETFTVESGGAVTLKGGETIVIEKIPYGTQYSITETEKATWKLTSATDAEGTIGEKDEQEAVFTNTYVADGSIDLKFGKTIEGRDFQEGDKWTFTITGKEEGTNNTGVPMPSDENGKMVNKVTIQPTSGVGALIDFGTIHYTQKDDGKTFVYTVTETGNISGVKNAEPISVKVTVKDNGDGTLTVEKDLSEEEMVFVNRYSEEDVPEPVPDKGIGTGDTMGMGAMLLMTLSAICALALLLRRRKEEDQQ